MIKKLLKILSLFFFIVFTLLYFVFDTRYGLEFVLSLSTKLFPGQLNYESATGKLGHAVAITHLNYQFDDLIISTDKLQLTYNWWHLLTTLKTPLQLNLDHVKIATNDQAIVDVNTFNIQGKLSINNNSQLTVASHQINYYLSPEEKINLPALSGTITGNYQSYQTQLMTRTQAGIVPKGKWLLTANGSTQAIEQFNLSGKLLDGRLLLKGTFCWSPHLSWQANLSGKHINPGVNWPDFPGNIQLDLTTTGTVIEEKPTIDVKINDISGKLINYPVLVKGAINYQPNKLNIKHFSLHSGNNHLKANGHINNTANLNIAGQFPNLNQLLPMLSGQAKLNAQIKGQGDNPYVQAVMTMNDIKYGDDTIDSAKLTVNGNALKPKPLRIDLTANRIKHGDQVIDKISTMLNRNNNLFSFKTSLVSQDTSLQTNLSATIKNNQYQGSLKQLSLTHKNKKILYLKTPISFVATSNSLEVKPNCIYSPYGSTCIQQLDFTKQNETLKGDLKLTANDFSYLATLIPQIDNPKGQLSANIQLSGSTDKPIITGNTQFNGSVAIPYLRITLSPINIQIKSNDQDLINYDASITSKKLLKITGTTEINNQFKTKLNIKGDGFEVINNDEAKVLVSPSLDINYEDNLIDITGNIDIPYAKITPLDFTSTTTLSDDVIMVDKQKKPEDELNIKSHVKITLGKAITFSYAGLTAKLSGDLTMLDNPGGDTTATGTLSIDKGRYKAYGQDLTIRNGKLIYTGGSITNPGLNIEAIRAVNVVSTSDGASEGAAYALDQQIVGLRIQGSADEPNLSFFAEPSGLSQSDILSYLILGKPSGSAGGAGAGTLLSALSFLDVGSHAESNIKGQLDHSLGLDVDLASGEEYDTEKGDVVNNTSLMLGKSITSRLKINYSIGIIVPINILTITYELTKRFSLKSNTSTEGTGIDIFYHYSKD